MPRGMSTGRRRDPTGRGVGASGGVVEEAVAEAAARSRRRGKAAGFMGEKRRGMGLG